ncbi:kinase-like protein, partial [Glonium stellatum]
MPISKVFTSDLPDLVRESKLDAQTLRGFTIHTFHDSSKIKEQGGPREEFWRRKERIGGGSFGQVWLEECVKGCRGPKLRAVKEITTTRHNIDYTRELEAIALFSHKKYERCFVKSFGWHEGADAIFITMEYLKHGDLHYYLHQASPLLEREACEITSQILHGLSFMHENGFAHRDLKPGNILIKSKPPKSWRVKIGDFGISKRTSDGLGLSTLKGTVGFIAPELYGFTGRRGSIPSTQNPSAADMWSLGEITFQMLTKTPTFKDLDSLSGFARGRRSFPSNILETRKVSDYGQNFIISVMKPSPNDRLTAEQALAHDWIKQ